ncbi:hypothetical protein, partial [Burkholderia sp. ABCPW 14]|uniref:hypothetical protein n=1 Tax=Burkholderia sp. ABCPW 14 TaxID=1637860 RepID=UPI001E580BA0
NAAECVLRVLFVISWVPLPALSLAQAPAVPLIRLSEFARPPLLAAWYFRAEKAGSEGVAKFDSLIEQAKLERSLAE